MQGCTLCPRLCGARRDKGARGVCGAADEIRVARAALHLYEEPCISVGAGSGAVFFSGCPLRCVFCQNRAISRGAAGAAIGEDRLYDIFFELKEKGAANINLVTPTHYADQIARVLFRAKRNGLDLPIVYNTSGYERVETLRMLEGLVDIYMPDFKYWDGALGKKYSGAPDYPEVAVQALKEMVRQRPYPIFSGERMTRGVLVRHLVLPTHVEDSKKIVRHIYEAYGDDVYISLMRQYTPPETPLFYPALMRCVTDEEYAEIVSFARDLGVTCGYTQQRESAADSFIPQFDLAGVLKNDGGNV